jgi:hypothetical protein
MTATVKICKIIGCDKQLRYSGMCYMHIKRVQTHGNPDYKLFITNKNKLCSNNLCDNSARKSGLCNSHYTAKWRIDNPLLARKNIEHSWRERGARKRNAVGQHSRHEWEELLKEYGGLCAYCRNKKADTKDHVIPIFNGGTNYISNILPACRSCNCSKHTRPLNDWLKRKVLA